MNDLDLVRAMRADAPIPSRRRLDLGRERLLAAIDSAPARRSLWPGRPFGGLRGGLLAAGAAAAVAAVAVATHVGVRGTPLHTAPAAQSARYTDPLVAPAAFGWLPRGMRAGGYVADRQQRHFFQVTAQKGTKGGVVTLTAYERGKEPPLGYLPGAVPAKRIPAKSINGHSAYWIYKPNPSGQSSFELRWQYAPKSWVDLQATGMGGDSAEIARTAYRIARTATFGGNRPVAMPLHVGGVPGGLTPKRTVLNNGAYGEVGAMIDFIVAGPSSELSISVSRSDGTVGTGTPGPNGAIKGLPGPNAKLDGYPAYRKPGFVYVYGVNGFDVQISATGSILAKLDRTGGVAGLFHRTTVLGGDETRWTTDPVN